MSVLVGTAGWADQDLIASGWYPAEVRGPADRLRYYANRFTLVEADSPYYAIPSPATTERWAQNTPDGFVMDVKAYSLLTGQPTRTATLPADLRALTRGPWTTRDRAAPELVDAAWQRFHEAIAPLDKSGRLGLVVLQFPASCRPDEAGWAQIETALTRCAPLPPAVEFRHGSWLEDAHRERALEMLRRHDAAFVAVDMPQGHPGAMPPTIETTATKAMIRLHGHSSLWATGSKEDRYRYEYTEDELSRWAERVRELARDVTEVHVVANTCCAGAAQRAASTLVRLLG